MRKITPFQSLTKEHRIAHIQSREASNKNSIY